MTDGIEPPFISRGASTTSPNGGVKYAETLKNPRNDENVRHIVVSHLIHQVSDIPLVIVGVLASRAHDHNRPLVAVKTAHVHLPRGVFLPQHFHVRQHLLRTPKIVSGWCVRCEDGELECSNCVHRHEGSVYTTAPRTQRSMTRDYRRKRAIGAGGLNFAKVAFCALLYYARMDSAEDPIRDGRDESETTTFDL